MFLLFKLSLVYSPNSPIFGIRQPPRQFWWLTKCEQGKRGSCNASSHPSAARMLSHSSACTVTPQLCTLSCEKLCNAMNIYLVKKKKTAHEEGTWPSQSNPPSCATWFSSIAWPQGGSPLLNAAPGGSSAARALSRNVKNMLKA